ncbi:MAG: ABC transporter permease [Pleurocapsa minor GSE-CHR-MK-17-07R]|jgi:ABC-2 type transport system permease protein|nr:ABC transporter permease [Pleurocapsa minor GSE-CHR-MK 17-07R]
MSATPIETTSAPRAVELGASAPWFAVFKRELRQYFRSPIAYGVAFALFIFLGFYFNGYLSQVNGQLPADATLIPSIITFLMFLIAPLLTMRLIAEENREGTLEVLMTMPMSESQFIIGKFLAVWAYYTILLVISLVFAVLLNTVGTPDWGAAVGAYVGGWLYGGAVLAITMIFSALSEDQIVSAFLGSATILVLYLANTAASAISTQFPAIAEIVRELGLSAHYDATMSQGILRLEDVLYFVFLIIAALFITTRIVEIRRWRS